MTEPAGDYSGRIVIISGPSGSGKTTVCRELLRQPEVTMSVSATTRPPRQGEVDGRDYWFLSREEFEARAARGEFAEYAEYNGNLYGTPREPLERAAAEGRTVLVEIDVQGARQLRERGLDALFIFLDAPDGAAHERLRRRATESEAELQGRVAIGERERRAARTADLFDARVINDDLGEAVARIQGLIRGGTSAATAFDPTQRRRP
jgi:guanylate kinase